MNKKSRKRSFLLIEVLLAIAVIGLCVYPLLAPHVMIAKAEMASFQQRNLERAADQAFIELVQGLHENMIPNHGRMEKVNWQSFEEPIEGTFSEPVIISISGGRSVRFLRKYEIKRVLEHEGENKHSDPFRLLEIHLSFVQENSNVLFAQHIYRLVIERGLIENGKKAETPLFID